MELVRYDAKRASLFGAAFSLILAVVLLAFDADSSPLFVEWRPSGWMDPLHPVVAVVAAVFTGMGLGSLVSLFQVNRKRLRAVFKPNRGRVLSGLALGFLCPVAHFSGLPFTLLFPVGLLLQSTSYFDLDEFLDPALLAFLFGIFVMGYLVSCLIISGARSRWVRIGLFGQFWLATYGAVFMIYGYSKFTL